jgi:hypothetical protein
MNIKRIIIWKHLFIPGRSGTHSFIHLAYHKAFNFLGYDTYWVNSLSEIDIQDYSNTLFFIEGNYDEIPLRDDCYYVLHHVNNKPFIENRCMFVNLCNFLLEPLSKNLSYNFPLDNSGEHGKHPLCSAEKIKDYVYYDLKNKAIYQPWGTNLLPHEIVDDIVEYDNNIKELNFIGSIWSENINQILPMIEDVINNDLKFNIYGWLQFNELSNYNNINKITDCGLPEEDAINLVKSSAFYPDIRGQHHINLGYIPCRLFKNISYGCIPITNSKLAYEFFDGNILYSPNVKDFRKISKQYLNNRDLEKDRKIIKLVKENHTYINRVNDLIEFIKIIYDNK